MALTPHFLDELRERVPLSQLIGRTVRLHRAGREHKGLCPFHSEKSPSFYVNDDKGFYHCFGCGAHGDVVRFLTDNQGLNFMDAVTQLANEAGLEVPRDTPQDQAKARRLSDLTEVCALAATWFGAQLTRETGSLAQDYLKSRGISEETAGMFGLGFAPDQREGLKTALLKQGVDVAQQVAAGLLIDVEGRAPYDRFRGRLMFPIRDGRGRVMAFGGRILGEGQPKYLNSPETDLFHKGRSLYNIDRASGGARKTQQLLVVEGYMDAIALDRVGFAAVAPLGTALTPEQIQALWRVAPEPLLCFDGDSAGQRAALRAALRILPLCTPGKSARFVRLPDGLDPDDLVKGAGGAEKMSALLASATPLVDMIWDSHAADLANATPERRAEIKTHLLALADAIVDPSVKGFYREEFQTRLRPQTQRFQRTGSDRYQAASRPSARLIAAPLSQGGDRLAEILILALVVAPDWAEEHLEDLDQLSTSHAGIDGLRRAALDALVKNPCLDKQRLANTLAESGFEQSLQTLDGRYRHYAPLQKLAQGDSEIRAKFSEAVGALLEEAFLRSERETMTQLCRQGQVPDNLDLVFQLAKTHEAAKSRLKEIANALGG